MPNHRTTEPNADLLQFLQSLSDDEISFTIECIPCTGFDVALGDEMNGFTAAKNFKSIEEAVRWLQCVVIEQRQQSGPSARTAD